jgi:hypothetical protein
MLPGFVLAVLGTIVTAISLSQLEIFGREWEIHTTISGSLLMIVGTQILALGLCAHAYGTYFMGEKDAWFDRMRARFRLEHGLVLGGAILLVGLVIAAVIVGTWIANGTGELSEERLAVFATTLVVVGMQVFFSSFLLSILGLRRR